MRALVFALTVAGLAGGGPQQPQTYTADYERNFMTSCEAQGSSSALCACSWDRIEAEIKPADFTALEQLPGPEREAHPLSARIEGYVMACAAQLAPAPDGEPAPAP